MKYIQQNYFNDFNTIRKNALKPRSYFIPFKDNNESNCTALQKRYSSSKVQVLNGEWDFKFYSNPNELPIEFDTDYISFDSIKVPSVFEYSGFSRPKYINTNYEFNFDEPNVPTTKPVTTYFCITGTKGNNPKDEYNYIGLYRKKLQINDLSKKYILSFLGVKSCLELYCNGNFVGYFEESHNTSEFSLNDFLTPSENEIVCIVHRWCNGTYLECQDMFRNTGIFRDVLLRIEDKTDIYDIDYAIKKNKEIENAITYSISFNIELYENTPLTLKCEELNIEKTIDGKKGLNHLEFKSLTVSEWNAEYPKLYDLNIYTKTCFVNEKVGFKDIEIINDIYYLNGKKIKFKGVNHHDTNPKTGYAMTAEDIYKDIQNCLDFNIDTIRTSHYDCDPLLYELAQEKGIYIISEVDIETHGCLMNIFPPNMSRLSNDPKWESHYLSRASSHYTRNRLLQTPIIMWSLGNEAGGGICIDAENAFFKSVSDIPTHYESVHNAPTKKMYDIASQMYPSVSNVEKVGNKSTKLKYLLNKPFFLCEYAHAMGVGPGNIESYWDAIYKYDSLIGGCIWEMNDHAVLEKDGSYTYGGDHNEWIHDGNFCVDGLFYPDRTPSTGALLAAFCYRPIRITKIDNKHYELFNTKSFRNADTYKIIAEISNGKKYELIESLEPLSKKIITLDLDIDINEKQKDLFITFKVIDLFNNKLVSEEQIVINYEIRNTITITKTDKFPEYFSINNGIPKIKLNDSYLTASDQYNLLYRSKTDNDVLYFAIDLMSPWYREKTKVISEKKEKNKVIIKSLLTVNHRIFLIKDEYTAVQKGILVESKLSPIFAFGNLPRFAKSFRLDSSFNTVEYFGKDKESYLDMQNHSKILLNQKTVCEMTEKNIKPQESGNRMHTRYVKLSNSINSVEFIAIDKAFELGIKPYSDLELTKMKHLNDEIRTGSYISLSAFQMGIGTGSCGPNTLKKHCYKANKNYSLKFIIKIT